METIIKNTIESWFAIAELEGINSQELQNFNNNANLILGVELWKETIKIIKEDIRFSKLHK